MKKLQAKLQSFLEIEELESLSDDDLKTVLNRVVLDNWKSNLIDETQDVRNKKQKYHNEIIQRLRERQNFNTQRINLQVADYETCG